MKSLILSIFVISLSFNHISAQSVFTLDPAQSMLMTGKRKGQDGAINPFYGEDSVAIIENIGDYDFSIRIQQKGKIIEIIPIRSKELLKVDLFKGYELYFDSNDEKDIQVSLDFEKME